jgi:hypothetical protein
MKNAIVVALVVAVALFVVYQYDPSFFGLLQQYDGFQDAGAMKDSNASQKPGSHAASGAEQAKQNAQKKEGFKEDKKDGFQDKKDGFQDKNEGFQEDKKDGFQDKKDGFQDKKDGFQDKKEGFADLEAFEGPANFGAAESPAGCYPRDQLTPSELLPKDSNSVWAEQNPMGPGSLKGKNFLSAGALIGVNTVGQSLRNANLQIRSEPPNPQVQVSIFNQSTISPDISHRPLEIGA